MDQEVQCSTMLSMTSSPTQKWPRRKRKPFGLESLLDFERRAEARLAVFVIASHRTGLDPRSMTRRSIIVGVEGGGCRAQAETRTLLDYAGHHCPSEVGPAEAGSLSNLSLTLNTVPGLIPPGVLPSRRLTEALSPAWLLVAAWCPYYCQSLLHCWSE